MNSFLAVFKSVHVYPSVCVCVLILVYIFFSLFSPVDPTAEEDAVETTQPAGVRQSARISFNDGSFKRPRTKRGSLSAQVLEKNTAAAAEEERIVEGQVAPGDTIKIEG